MRVLWKLLIVVEFLVTAAIAAGQSDIASSFDRESGPLSIETQFQAPDFVPGIWGEAWRTDGFSSFATARADFDKSSSLNASLWVALESYPSDLEVVTSGLSPSSFLNQASRRRGFDLFIDTYGRWGLRIDTTSGRRELRAPEVFPLYQWTHVGFRFAPAEGTVQLILNGEVVAAESVPARAKLRGADEPMIVAKSWKDQGILNFRINGLNGAIDELRISKAPRATEEFLEEFRETSVPDALVSLRVPESRFAGDHLRPRYHALPPANWANEPHGLVFANGRYHMFYQRTPNGPYKTQMHWGHMSSADLVEWTYHRDALWPTLQTETFGFDMKGIWSGDVIFENGAAYAYYTSVNHFDTFNPGVSVAVSTDPNLEFWEKRGPIIDTTYVRDFRDPYLFEKKGVWHMIIGAAAESGGGLDYYTCTDQEGRHCWEHRRNFANVTYADLDIGSIIWEMPVFEELSGGAHLLLVNPIGGKVTKYGDPATRAVYWTGEWVDGQLQISDTTPKNQDLLPGQLAPTVARQANGKLAAIGIVDERRNPQSQEDAGWTHTFSLPREWYLMDDGSTLGQRPLASLERLRIPGTEGQITGRVIEATTLLADRGHQAEFRAAMEPMGASDFGIVVAATEDRSLETLIYYDADTREIVLDKGRSTGSDEGEGPQVLRSPFDVAAFGEPRDWHVFVDGSVVDIFINGAAATSFRTYPDRESATRIGIYAEGGAVRVDDAKVWQLRDDAVSW